MTSSGRSAGPEHGWHTVATQCGLPTSPHTPREHGPGPTMTWYGLPAVETMHITAQPRQHASDRTQEAQTDRSVRACRGEGERKERYGRNRICVEF